MPSPEASSLPNLAFEFLPDLDLMVVHHLETGPADGEWDELLAAMATPLRSGRFRSIVISEGAHPTQAQQARMNALVRGQPARVAVLCSAGAVRFVVSVFALVNREVKAFSPREYENAFAHLDVAPLERAGVLGVIQRLRDGLDPPELVTARRRRPEFPPTTTRRSQTRYPARRRHGISTIFPWTWRSSSSR